MSVQLSLLQDTRIKKSIITVPIDKLEISEFNPRKRRSQEDIDKLAKRIVRNGFEITRALWAYQNGDGYKVFAGGTRLEAAKGANLSEVPIILHEGITEDEIVKLADEDNENDEYHIKLNPFEIWEYCAYLSNHEKWSQQKISDVLGKAQPLISDRINLYHFAMSYPKIRDFITGGEIAERNLRQIMRLSPGDNLSDWLVRQQAWYELACKIVKDKSKNGRKSEEAVKKDIAKWKAFIQEAENVYQSLPESITLYRLDQSPPAPYEWNAKAAFVRELAKRSARSIVKVREAANFIRTKRQENLAAYQLYVEKKSVEAAREAIRAKQEKETLDRFVLGDCLNTSLPNKIKLLLLDPPYGKNYQSNRRWASNAPKKIKGDTQNEAIELLRQTIRKATLKLLPDAHILVFCDWQIEPTFRQVLEDEGLKLKGSLIWVKEEHSAGDVKGTFGPSHERILHAVQGAPVITPRIRDVIECNRSNETNHPTEKPIPLLKKLIASTTNEGDLVVDLFAGCASILLAAMMLRREFWGVEIDETYHEEGCMRLLELLRKNNATEWV